MVSFVLVRNSMKKIFIAVAAISVIIAVVMITAINNSKGANAMSGYNFEEMDLIQLEEPEDGQMMAVIDTTEGVIKAVLYPEYAPNTVDNFVNRANEGFYDNKSVYAIINECLFMTGAYNEEGTQGFTNDGNPIPNENDVDLWTFKGALCSYSGQTGYGDSRFYIVDEFPITEEEFSKLRSKKNKAGTQIIPEELLSAYEEHKGIIHLAGTHTVFGQTIEGFEVVEKICDAEYDAETMRPLNEIKINSVRITEYKSEEEVQ